MFTINTFDYYDCTKKCRNLEHGRSINTALTKKSIPDEKLAAYIAKTCRNFTEVLDYEGRSALHLACSVNNRYAIVEWLLNQGAAIHKKDTENGNSPLHRSLFYGCIDCAVLLLRYGANAELLDDESLNSLQLICKPSELDYFRNVPQNNDCLVWGTNKNYNLGIENFEGTNSPQIVDVFRKQNICIVSVALSTFHSLFIDKKGDIYAVGHGNGGRLGNSNEKSLPSPKRIKLPTKKSDEKAIGISCSKNHSLVLSSTSAVYSCGLNTDQQLGIKPAPEMLNAFKEIIAFAQYGVKDLLEVVAKDCYSIALNNKEVYVWGRNSGQFGIKDDTSHLLLPKMLPLTEKKILILKATNSAIACYTESDNWLSKQIVLFSNYKIKTIKTPFSERVLNMCITGGDFDKSGKAATDNPLRLLILMAFNGLYIWYDDIQQYIRCVSLPRTFQIKNIWMKSNKLMILSNGYVYSATGVKIPVYKPIEDFEKFNDSCTDHCSTFKFRIDLQRIPHIDRAFAIFCDDDFESFAALEENSRKYFILPQLGAEEYTFKNLLHEASEMDGIHDILFHVDNEVFPAHKYIIFSRAKGLMKIVKQFNDKDIYFNYKNLTGKIFELILKHIYTNYFLSEEDLDDIQKSLGPETNASRQEILSIFEDFTIQFGLHELSNFLKCSNHVLDGVTAKQKSRFLRLKVASLPELYDVTIKCARDEEIKAHKCVLVARLEYFNLMFNNRWSETKIINLSTVPLEYMSPIIEFLYTSDVDYFRKQKFSESFLYNMIVICDQFFINRLRRVCEILLLEKISIRKCGEMLEFACLYNCELLERGCLEFICYNLARVLEQRILEGYDFAVLSKVSQFYRELFKEKLDFRVITPASDSIDDDLLLNFINDFNVDLEFKAAEVEKSKIKNKSKLSKSEQFKRNYEKQAICAMKENSVELSLPRPDTSANVKNQIKTEIDNVCDQIHAKSETWMKVNDKKDVKRKTALAAIKTNVIMKEEKKPESDFTNLSMIIQANSPNSKTGASPNVSFSLNEDPMLSVNRQSYTSLGDFTPLKTEKMSQKQRKRLSSETKTENSLIRDTKPIPIPTPQQNSVWGVVSSPTSDHSFADIMKSPQNSFPHFQSISPEKNTFSNTLKTPPKSFSNITTNTSSFTKILADERKQKEYYDRIKSKSLILTQIEETAIAELKAFYNIDNVDDEHITVERKSLPVTMNFAVWQHN